MYVPALIKTTAPRPRVRRQLQKLMRRRNQIIGDGKNSLWSLIILPAHLVMASMRHRESERSAHTHTRESDTSQIQFPPYLKAIFCNVAGESCILRIPGGTAERSCGNVTPTLVHCPAGRAFGKICENRIDLSIWDPEICITSCAGRFKIKERTNGQIIRLSSSPRYFLVNGSWAKHIGTVGHKNCTNLFVSPVSMAN